MDVDDAGERGGVLPPLDLGDLGRLPDELLDPVPVHRKGLLLLPPGSGPQQLRGPDRLLLAVGDDAQKTALPHHAAHGGKRPRGRVVHIEQAGAGGRRPDDPAEQLAGQPEVVDERR